MKISVCTIGHLDDNSAKPLVDALLPLVPPRRRAEALRYKSALRQYMTLKSFCMLQDIVGHSLPDWQTGEYGKPYYDAQQPIFFSLSHCRHAIAVAVADYPVGIDVESIDRRLTPDLVRYTMNTAEQADIFKGAELSGNFAIDPVIFLSYWTRKEAYLKLVGTGINGDMKDVLVNLPPDIVLSTTSCPEQNYVLTTAEQK